MESGIDILPKDPPKSYKELLGVTEHVKDYIDAVEDALLAFFIYGFDASANRQTRLQIIRSALKDNNAIISGGFILKSIGLFDDPKSIDIDVYVSTDKSESLKDIFSKLFKPDGYVKHIASTTSGISSFLQKNGINSVQKYHKNIPSYAEMDIVEVIKTPIEVVQNFDLSFCEAWYDGEKLYASFPNHVTNKKGFLQNEYVKLYEEGNKVTKKRMLKYINRGFRISIKKEGAAINITDIIKLNHTLVNSSKTNNPITSLNKYSKWNKSLHKYKKWNSINTTKTMKNKKPVIDVINEGELALIATPVIDVINEGELALIATHIIEVVSPKSLNIPKRLGGTTGAYLFVKIGEPGNFWVVKGGGRDAFSNFGGGIDQVKSESLTNDIYEAAGVRVPAHRFDETANKLILKYIDGLMLINYVGEPEFNSIKEDLCKHFVIDVLVSNYDVIGAEYDNVMIPSDETEAVRIDNGAGLTYRAMGRFKTEFDGSVRKELDSDGVYRTKSESQTPIQTIFSDLTDQQIAKQILEHFTPEKIDKILSVIPEGIPGLPSSDPPLMKDIIRERIEYMIEWASEPKNGGRRTKKKRSTKCKRRTLKFKHGRHRAAYF